MLISHGGDATLTSPEYIVLSSYAGDDWTVEITLTDERSFTGHIERIEDRENGTAVTLKLWGEREAWQVFMLGDIASFHLC